MLAFPILAGGQRERGEKVENPFIPPPQHKGSGMDFPLLAGGE
jgi:hypothetical protein